MELRLLIKDIIPPFFIRFFRHFFPAKHGWAGGYDSWDDASENATGYDQDNILKKVRSSLLKVKNGEALYERDGVLLDQKSYSPVVLAGLLISSQASQGRLSVLDFGGSLGSTYFQNKKILDAFGCFSWSIVEQENFVEVGSRDFGDGSLKFYKDVRACLNSENPTALLLLSVLQYIRDPYLLLDELLSLDLNTVIIDRTPFSKRDKELVMLQVVPPHIYNASYPCWFFEEVKFKSFFTNRGYSLVEEFDALEGESIDYVFKGMIWKK